MEAYTFQIISIDNTKNAPSIIRVTNIMGQEVPLTFEGLRIIYYSDGSTLKKAGR